MRRPHTSPVLAITAVALLLAVSACSSPASSTASATEPADTPTTPTSVATTPSPTPSPNPDADPTGWVVGYPWGEMPAIPLIVLPDLGLLDSSVSQFAVQLKEVTGSYPGLTFSPARCDEMGTVQAQNGSLLLYGDGSGVMTGPDGAVVNYGDGSGNFTLNGVSVQVYGDGSGNYSDGVVSIQNYGDGSGNYLDTAAGVSVQIYGDGSGSYTSSETGVSIQNYGDGSGSYTSSETGISIQNYGDGSGNYNDGVISITNYGDGTGVVNGVRVELEPIDEVAPLGSFPPMGVLSPITSCGTTITLSSGVLFDIDEYAIRPDAAAVLDSLARALTDLGVPAAEVAGHTDDVRDEAWNQTLSQNRAAAVVEALTQRGVTSTLSAVGYGESRPIAANEVNGVPDPAGRQLNRRVEIFIPAF